MSDGVTGTLDEVPRDGDESSSFVARESSLGRLWRV